MAQEENLEEKGIDKKKKEEIREDFKFLEKDKRVLSILIFGSRAKRYTHERSDVDVCIVAPNQDTEGIQNILMKVFRNLDTEKKSYDVHIFEELPLYMKISVIKNHEIVHSRDKYEMYEYLYRYRKIWRDQEKRNTMTRKELKKAISQSYSKTT